MGAAIKGSRKGRGGSDTGATGILQTPTTPVARPTSGGARMEPIRVAVVLTVMPHRVHLVVVQPARRPIPATSVVVPLLEAGATAELLRRGTRAPETALPLHGGVTSRGVGARQETRTLPPRSPASMATRVKGRALEPAAPRKGALKVTAKARNTPRTRSQAPVAPIATERPGADAIPPTSEVLTPLTPAFLRPTMEPAVATSTPATGRIAGPERTKAATGEPTG